MFFDSIGVKVSQKN